MRHAAPALVAVMLMAGCDRLMPGAKPAEDPPAAAGVPAAPAALEAASGERGDARLQPPVAQARLHGGRTAAWWKERLEVLQRQQAPALYRLTLQRAKAAGLKVVEGPPLAVSEDEVVR